MLRQLLFRGRRALVILPYAGFPDYPCQRHQHKVMQSLSPIKGSLSVSASFRSECSWDKHRDGLLCDHSIPKGWLVDAGRFFPQLQWIWCYGDLWSSYWPTRSCMAKFAAVGENFIERYSYREVEQLTINCNYSAKAILYYIIWPLQGT